MGGKLTSLRVLGVDPGSRITGYEIVKTENIFGTTYVTVKLEGLGPDAEDEIELEMEQDGKKSVFFDSWKVAGNGVATPITGLANALLPPGRLIRAASHANRNATRAGISSRRSTDPTASGRIDAT